LYLKPNCFAILVKVIKFCESDGGKSFHKIGYVIVDLACFVLGGFVRCRRRYLLKGYDGDKRRVGKRQDNSLLVVSFTCQQHFGNTCFRLYVTTFSRHFVLFKLVSR
uniref:Secreted protein n=1 Tax=Taenia asiatica TaxID=60517 RepID=A0A0R3VUH5_TAEAS